MTAQVFISYSSRNANEAKRLASDLESTGLSVWLDQWSIWPGECIPTKIAEGIETCRFLVLMLSSHAVESAWVDREWKMAYWAEIQRNQLIVIPTLIEPCAIPQLIITRRYVDLSRQWSDGVSQLSFWIHESIRRDAARTFYALAQSVAAELGGAPASRDRNDHWDLLARALIELPSGDKLAVQRTNSLHYLAKWGLSVQQLRVALESIGFGCGTSSPHFDAKLAAALMAFQREHCMRHVDGIFGPLTYEKMHQVNGLVEQRRRPT